MSVFNNLVSAEAMLSANERLALAHAAASLEPGSVILDLGTSAGGSADIFLHSSPQSQIYTIDIEDKIHRPVRDNPRLNIYHGNAEQFVAENPTIIADMVFIDASHYFFDATYDFKVMSQVLKDTAILAFHDCIGPKFPGIMTLCKTLSDNGNLKNSNIFDSLFIGEFVADVPMPDAGLFVENMGQLASMLNVWLPTKPIFSPKHTHKMEQLFASLRDGKPDAPWVVGQGKRGETFAEFVGFDASRLVHSSEVSDGDQDCIVCSYYLGEITGLLQREKGMRPDSVLDSLEVMQYGFYEDLAFNKGTATMRLAKSAFQKDIVRHLSTMSEDRLKRLYVNGCFWDILEDLFIR